MLALFSVVSVMSDTELYTDIQILELTAALGTKEEVPAMMH